MARDFFASFVPRGLDFLASDQEFEECVVNTVDDETMRKWMGDCQEDLWYAKDDVLRAKFPGPYVEEFIQQRTMLGLTLQHIEMVSKGVMRAIAGLQVAAKKLSVQHPTGPAPSSETDSSANYCCCVPEDGTTYSGYCCSKCNMPVF